MNLKPRIIEDHTIHHVWCNQTFFKRLGCLPYVKNPWESAKNEDFLIICETKHTQYNEVMPTGHTIIACVDGDEIVILGQGMSKQTFENIKGVED